MANFQHYCAYTSLQYSYNHSTLLVHSSLNENKTTLRTYEYFGVEFLLRILFLHFCSEFVYMCTSVLNVVVLEETGCSAQFSSVASDFILSVNQVKYILERNVSENFELLFQAHLRHL